MFTLIKKLFSRKKKIKKKVRKRKPHASVGVFRFGDKAKRKAPLFFLPPCQTQVVRSTVPSTFTPLSNPNSQLQLPRVSFCVSVYCNHASVRAFLLFQPLDEVVETVHFCLIYKYYCLSINLLFKQIIYITSKKTNYL